MRPLHWFILILIALILFGAQKLPEVARSLGRSAKILKEELADTATDPAGSEPPASKAPGSSPQAPTPLRDSTAE